ncbi:hypothetical protein GCM10010266_12150 [Streptomyces griseomycini]|nr:hypothetical protein GCM10010266_12150 [Streptomyces griseomycini]
MDAVLFLPPGYRESAREGSARHRPRSVAHEGDGGIRVRLTHGDSAPRSPVARARDAHAGRDGHDGDACTRYARTGVQDHEAVPADTTYGPDERPTCVTHPVVRTDDGRTYGLRVDVPRGAPREEEGRRCSRASVTDSRSEDGDPGPSPRQRPDQGICCQCSLAWCERSVNLLPTGTQSVLPGIPCGS